jgi:hypothetical protein
MKKWVIYNEQPHEVLLLPHTYSREMWYCPVFAESYYENEMFDSVKEVIEARMVLLSENIVKLLSEHSRLAEQLREINKNA